MVVLYLKPQQRPAAQEGAVDFASFLSSENGNCCYRMSSETQAERREKDELVRASINQKLAETGEKEK